MILELKSPLPQCKEYIEGAYARRKEFARSRSVAERAVNYFIYPFFRRSGSVA